jgi:hypothetical protein
VRLSFHLPGAFAHANRLCLTTFATFDAGAHKAEEAQEEEGVELHGLYGGFAVG